MTTDNQTREQALTLLETTPDDLTASQAARITTERMAMLTLSVRLGVPSFRRWLAEMPSREYTEYRAMSLVETAQRMIEASERKR